MIQNLTGFWKETPIFLQDLLIVSSRLPTGRDSQNNIMFLYD